MIGACILRELYVNSTTGCQGVIAQHLVTAAKMTTSAKLMAPPALPSKRIVNGKQIKIRVQKAWFLTTK
jgi:hypothetical protein